VLGTALGIMAFEKYGNLQPFDDGHIPETAHGIKTRIVSYADCSDDIESSTVQIHDKVLTSSLCEKLYERTVEHEIPWGTYVTKEEAMSAAKIIDEDGLLDGRQSDTKCEEQFQSFSANTIQELATEAVAQFLFSEKLTTGTAVVHGNPIPSLIANDRVHGVQVWALASGDGSSVPYHIDYAEYIRYTENVIVTPLHAGTIQCTPNSIYQHMKGGTFAVNVHGLAHYNKWGYKGKKMEDVDLEKRKSGGWEDPHVPFERRTNNNVIDEEASGIVIANDGWVSIPYKFNQGILHTGNLPHLSSKIFDLDSERSGARRVIIGFNVFCHDVGSRVKQTPEHSHTFRKLVKLHRAMSKFGAPECQKSQSGAGDKNRKKCDSSGSSNTDGVQIESFRNNKTLRKILVLAKREKVKSDWLKCQESLTRWIHEQLNDAGSEGLAVDDLLSRWKDTQDSQESTKNEHETTIQITLDDVLVHINQMVFEEDENVRILRNDNSISILLENGLVKPCQIIVKS